MNGDHHPVGRPSAESGRAEIDLAKVRERMEGAQIAVVLSRREATALLDRIEELEAVLAPFVALVKSHDDAGVSFLRSDQAEAAARLTDDELAEMFAPANEVPLTDGAMRSPVRITWGDFRRARKALSGEKP